MGACSFVGRVGGLAVALGVGAAVFGGSSVAWADGSTSGVNRDTAGSSASSDPVSEATPARRGRIASSAGSRTVAARTGRNALPPSAAARSGARVPARVEANTAVPVAADVTVAVKNIVESQAAVPRIVPTVLSATADSVAAQPKSSPVAPAAAPASTAVSGVLTALPDPLSDVLADGGPAAPADSPLAWSVMAYTRRATAVAKAVAAVPVAAATQPVILGPSGVPIPPDWYVAKVMEYYVPTGANAPQVVFTPEGLYPITGVKSLPLSISVDQGLTILSDTLGQLPDGTATTMFGYSQSAIIGSLIQSGFNSTPVPANVADTTDFVFVGNEMNPNGGLLSRFPGLNLPSLGIPFYGATPENAYPTTNYTLEYDGFADVPRYPINFLADLNAALGILFVHTKYTPRPDCTSFCTTLQQVQDAVALPSTSPTEKYFFMPTENLPLLQPLRGIPIIGTPIVDLFQPVLKVIVDLGYADPAHGFTSAVQPVANVQLPFGLFPQIDPHEVITMLVAGMKQGIHDFLNDFGKNGSIAREISSRSMVTQPFAAGQFIPALQNAITNFGTWLSTAIAALYTPLLPTADIANALIVSLPVYDVNLVLSSIKQMISGEPIKGLINAVGLPLASSVGLITYASLIELLVWGQSARALVPAD